MSISKKASLIKPSPTLSLSALADEKREQGIDIINFSAGEMPLTTTSPGTQLMREPLSLEKL